MMQRLIFLTLAALIFSQVSHGQNAVIKLDKDSMLIGEYLKLSIEAESPYKASFFLPDSSNLGLFEYIEMLSFDTTDNTLKAEWLITCFDSGYYAFGPIPLLLVSENKQKIDTVFSNNVLLYVNTIPVNLEEDIKPAKEQKNIPFPWKEVLMKVMTIVGIIFLIAMAIMTYYLRKKRKLAEANRVKTPVDFYIETLQKLQQIEQEKLWQKDQIKEYYFSLSETLRNYIEGRFGVNAMELTTDEIVALMQGEIADGLNNKLKDILSQADLAKYAKFKPMPDENIKIMKLSKDFVLHTKPKVENDVVE